MAVGGLPSERSIEMRTTSICESNIEKVHSDSFTQRVEQFLRSVQKAYAESWESCAICTPSEKQNIIRGRARCIAGRVEDLFAEALYDILKDRIEGLLVFVDLPLSYELNECDDKGKNLKGICYPDVVVAQRMANQINVLYLVELKVNLGWGRHKLTGEGMFKNEETGKKEWKEVTPIEDEITGKLQELIGVKVWSKIPFSMKSEQDFKEMMNDELRFVVTKDARYDLIVCSSKNVPKHVLQKARKRIGEDISAVCQLYVLSEDELSLKYVDNENCHDNDVLCSKDVGKWKRRIDALVEGLGQD